MVAAVVAALAVWTTGATACLTVPVGEDPNGGVEVCVTVDGRRFTSAWGPNKKMAEQKAALLALEELGVLAPEEVDEAIEVIATETPSAIRRYIGLRTTMSMI